MVAIEDVPPFASAAQLEAFTKGKLKSADTRVPLALAAVSRSIRREAGWHIWPLVTGHVLTLDGPGGRVLSLPSMRIKTLTSIVEAGTALDVTTLDVSRETGLVEKQDGCHWTRRYGQLVVTMDHGEDVDEAEDLLMLTLKLAARGLASPMGATREQAGALSVNWSMTTQGVTGGLVPTPDERSVMASYKLTGWR